MYNNIGGKIKVLAKIAFIAMAAITAIAGLGVIASDDDLIGVGVLMMFAGPVVAWVSSWLLYGFGQLIENSDIIAGRK